MSFLAFTGGADIECDIDPAGSEVEIQEVGGRRRAIDGTMHSTIRERKRSWRFRGIPLPIAAAVTLYDALTAAAPVQFDGVALDGDGVDINCHVEVVRESRERFSAATADGGQHRSIEFLLHEQ